MFLLFISNKCFIFNSFFLHVLSKTVSWTEKSANNRVKNVWAYIYVLFELKFACRRDTRFCIWERRRFSIIVFVQTMGKRSTLRVVILSLKSCFFSLFGFYALGNDPDSKVHFGIILSVKWILSITGRRLEDPTVRLKRFCFFNRSNLLLLIILFEQYD